MDPLSPATPPDSPLTMQDVMASPDYRHLWTAKVGVGDPAPPFTLPLLGSPERRTVALDSFRDVKPVALIFGSYT